MALFPQPPVIWFAPEREECLCGVGLVAQKTRCKTVKSMNGPFIAHETMLQCPACLRLFGSEPLLRLVPSRCNVAFDVLVFVGQALFQRYRTTQEIRAELVARNVRLSASEVGYLGRKYIFYLAVAHRRATPRIRQAMRMAGGYILHLDAMHDDDALALMTGIDSMSKIVLANVKVPSEHADHIVPFLRKLKADYGSPRACVHDMGLGICKAVSEVFPGIYDFICHFHFLRDIGKDFLEPAYQELRKTLRKYKTSSRLRALARETKKSLSQQGCDFALQAKAIETIVLPEDKGLLPIALTYSLALWSLHGKQSGDGYGFPFDRPLMEFAERLLELNRRLPEFLDLLPNGDNQSLSKLAQEVSNYSQRLGVSPGIRGTTLAI